MRIIPKEDMMVATNVEYIKGFNDAVFCPCGKTINFKNRKPRETVEIICPKCNFKIIYG